MYYGGRRALESGSPNEWDSRDPYVAYWRETGGSRPRPNEALIEAPSAAIEIVAS